MARKRKPRDSSWAAQQNVWIMRARHIRSKTVLTPDDIALPPEQERIVVFYRTEELAGRVPPAQSDVARHLGVRPGTGHVKRQIYTLTEKAMLLLREGKRYDIRERRKVRRELTDLGRAVADRVLSSGDNADATQKFEVRRRTPAQIAKEAGEIYIAPDEDDHD